MMTTIDMCPECGSEVELVQNFSIRGISCKKCGWGVVTSCLPEIVCDKVDYTVYITQSNYKDKKQIRILSRITGLNYLDVRKLLQEDTPLIFKGRASEVLTIKEQLTSEGISYKISPRFKY